MGPWDLIVARTESYLGECLTAEGRFADAEPLLVSSYEALNAAAGPRSPFTAEALSRVVALYDQWHKPAEAARYRGLVPK